MATTTPAPLQPSAARPRRRHLRRTIVRWTKRVLLAAIGAGTIAGLVYAWLPRPVVVDVARTHRTALAIEVAEDGKTRVVDRYVVSAPISGNLQRVQLEAGAAIAGDTVVARIDPPDPALLDERTRREATARLAAAVAHRQRAETAIASATATRDAASRDADRARVLADRGAITAYDHERADLAAELALRELAAARSERAGADAEVAAARAILGEGSPRGGHVAVEVRAPTSGRVLRVVRDSAGPIAMGAPMIEIGDPHAIEIVVDVLSSDAARIAAGMEVAIDGWGGDQTLPGKVRLVEPSAFTRISALGVEEQRVKVIAAIENPPQTLGDGFRVDARIVTWRGDHVLVVPASALFRDHERWAVYAIVDGRARLRAVVLGHRGKLDVELSAGLDEGVDVVLHPGDSVTDGARVEPR